jgi:predicted transcriptional regulator
MSDFNQDELFETIDRAVQNLFKAHRVEQAPVDAVELVQAEYGYIVRELDPEEEAELTARGQPMKPAKRRSREIVFNSSHGVESRNILSARAIARELIPNILKRLGVSEGTENRSATTQLVGLITPRILLPTRWFEREAPRQGYDLWKLKEVFSSATYEMITARLLDLEEPCIMVIVDDGEVAARKSNRTSAPKKLTDTEKKCLDKVGELGEPQTVRSESWTVRGWPIPTGPFNRIILRSVPEEL